MALELEREDVPSRLEQLRNELAAVDCELDGQDVAAPSRSPPLSMTPVEKVALFRPLFRGCDDVYPNAGTLRYVAGEMVGCLPRDDDGVLELA